MLLWFFGDKLYDSDPISSSFHGHEHKLLNAEVSENVRPVQHRVSILKPDPTNLIKHFPSEVCEAKASAGVDGVAMVLWRLVMVNRPIVINTCSAQV